MASSAAEPFEWGSGDCVLKAARVADAIVVEPCFEAAARAAFSWTDEESALARLVEVDGLRNAVVSVLGESMPWQELSQGDLVLCRTGSDEPGKEYCVAVHDGVNPVAFVGDSMRSLPWRLAECGWEV